MFYKYLTVAFLLLSVLLSNVKPSEASDFSAKGSIPFKNLSKQLGDKIVNVKLISVSSQTGNIFMLVRNGKLKTRNLEWAVYNPYKGSVVKQGSCPFSTENRYTAFSPDGKFAAAFSSFPSALWVLNLENGVWKKVYENPPVDKGGMAIKNPANEHPLLFVANDIVATVLPDYKASAGEKSVSDIVSVYFSAVDGTMTKGSSLKGAFPKIISLMKKKGMESVIKSGPISVIDENRVVYVMSSLKSKDEYVFIVSQNSEPVYVGKASGKISYNDFLSKKDMMLYSSKTSDRKAVRNLYLWNGSSLSAVDEGNIIFAKLRDNGEYIVAKQDLTTNFTNIFASRQGKVEKILTKKVPSYYILIKGGTEFFSIDFNGIEWYRIAN